MKLFIASAKAREIFHSRCWAVIGQQTANSGQSSRNPKAVIGFSLISHLHEMAQAMESDIPSCPIDVTRFRAYAMVVLANATPELIQQYRRLRLILGKRDAFHGYLSLYACAVSLQSYGSQALWTVKGKCIPYNH